MRKPTFPALVVLSFLLAPFAVGCNSGSSTPANPPSVTTTSLPAAVAGTAYSFTLQATGGTGAYTWSISSGSLPSWASLDPGSGTISGMPDTAATTIFSVAVTDAAGRSDTQSLSLVVSPAPLLAITTNALPDGAVGFPYTAKLQATGGIPPYAWSITSGSLPSGVDLNSQTGSISGSPQGAEAATFTAQVTDSQDAPASATQQLSVTIRAANAAGNSLLNGQYTFLLQGFDDATGNQFAIVGSFITDGNGKVTGGLEDVNGPGGFQPVVTLTGGAYSVGTDRRGVLNLTSSLGTTTFAIAVGSLNSSNVATQGSLIEFDDTTGTSGKRGSGSVYLQDASAFNLASINGPYAFQFVGQAVQAGTRFAVTGAFTADGNGNMKDGQIDTNAEGVMANGPFTASIGTDGKTAQFGRVSVTPTGFPLNYVTYIVSTDRALVMSSDKESTAGLVAGDVLRQASTPFSPASLSGKAVSYSVGLAPMFYNEDSMACARLWTFTPSPSPTASTVSDCIYSWFPSWWDFSGGMSSSYASYTVAANGRAAMTSTGEAGTTTNPIFYLLDTNKGFVMSTDSSVSTGFLEPQEGGPFSTASISGSYFLGTVAAAINMSAVTSGAGISSGEGTLSLTADRSDLTGLLSSTDSVPVTLTIDASGRGKYLQSVLYVISPGKVILMSNPDDASPTIMILQW